MDRKEVRAHNIPQDESDIQIEEEIAAALAGTEEPTENRQCQQNS